MSVRFRYIITPKNLREVVAGFPTGKTIDYLYTFLSIILDNCKNDPYYFKKNDELSKVLFTETFPALIDYFISQKSFESLLSVIPTYAHLINFMCFLHKFTFIPFLVNFFDITKSLSSYDSFSYYIESQLRIKNVKKSANLNLYQKFLIEQISRQQVIQVLINDFPSHQSFSECSGYFAVFNRIFPFVEKTVLVKYEAEFSRYSYSIDDPRFEDPVSVQLTKAMSECSTKYAQIHFDNVIRFLMSESTDEIKIEFVSLLKNSDNLKCIETSLLEMIDFILALMRDDEKKLKEISMILISNKICDENFFIEKTGNDLYFNLAFFDMFKERYNKEFVESIIESEEFCEKTVEFGFKIIEYKIELMPNLSSFLKKCFSSFWTEERMDDIISLSKKESSQKVLLDSINSYEIKNYKDYKIICEIVILLKPSINDFNYQSFVDNLLFYTDSIYIIPFLTTNSFIPLNFVDVEDLLTFCVFDDRLSNFLLANFSDVLINNTELLLDLPIDNENENKCLGLFLLNLFKKSNSEKSCLIWEAVFRLCDENDEVHSIAQKLINENPEKSQQEIYEKIENGYSRYFVNFDFSCFSESSAEENGNYLFFCKPTIVSTDSIFYIPSKIGHALNHSEPIEISEVEELFEFFIGDIGIDSVIHKLAFDAAMKLNIEFKIIQQSLEIAFQLKYKLFIDQLFQYILNNSKEVIQIDNNLLNSFAEIDANYAIELIKKKNFIPQILNLFFLKNQTNSALSILRQIDFQISIGLMYHIIYTKSDFINFCKSNRINKTDILPFIFSLNFPQFYRTKNLMNSIFQLIQNDKKLLLDFLVSQEWESNIKKNSFKDNFIPFVESNYYSAYLSFALFIPSFCDFPKSSFSLFLSNLIYSLEGEENQELVSPIKEPVDEIRRNKTKPSRTVFYHFLDLIISELPNEILNQFELIYSTKNSLSTSNLEILHDFSVFIYGSSISIELEKYSFFNQPKIFLFKIQKCLEFQIEYDIFINGRKYSLSCIGTKSSVYIPQNKKENRTKFVKLSNGEKSKTDYIEGKIVFMFYHLNDDNDGESNEFEIVKHRLNKFRKSEFKFNKRAIICDSLNKAEIEWDKWDADENLFRIATILFSDVGYSDLFNALSSNERFSEFFFKSDWKEKFSMKNADQNLIKLANIYQNRDELIDSLIDSLNKDDRKHCSSIILNSFNLTDDCIEKVIKTVSPQFEYFENMIVNYFIKPTTTNKLLQDDPSLAKFVFTKFEKLIDSKIEWKSVTSLDQLPYSHLLSPMNENLFLACSRTLSKKVNSLILESFGKTATSISHCLTFLPHGEEMASLFCSLECTEKVKEDLRNDIEWIEYGLSSSNDKIRHHSLTLVQSIFTKEEGSHLSLQLKGAILRSLLNNNLEDINGLLQKYFGYGCIDSPEFVSDIFDRLFNTYPIPKTYPSIERILMQLSPPPCASIIRWHYTIKQYDKNSTEFLVYATNLLHASLRNGFQPPFVGFFEDVLTPLYMNISLQSLHFYFEFLDEFMGKKEIFELVKMMVEFDVIVVEYVSFISKILVKNSDFRETELIVIALILPSVVQKRRRLAEQSYANRCSVDDLMVLAIETATKALNFILKNDKQFCGLIRKSGKSDIDTLMTDFYKKSYLNFFLVDFFVIVDSLINSKSISKEFRNSSLKKLIKYVTLSALAFPDVLRTVFDTIVKIPGLRIFYDSLQFVEFEWSELCVEIARQILSDIEFNSIEFKKSAVSIVDRELCSQLYHYNSAEKSFLRFLIGVMKNDQLRIQSGLQCNPQIFNVFRNDFVFCIDDVALFIDASLEKYDNFFNENDIKNFILNLKISDNQIKQKLKIILNLMIKSLDNMKKMIVDVFPKIEELSSLEGLDEELSDLINQILEQSLIIMSLSEE